MNYLQRTMYKLNRLKNQVYYQSKFDFNAERMQEIQKKNCELINKDFEIVNNQVMQESHFGYGIPESLYADGNFLLNNPINNDLTYTDVICYFSYTLKKINYLELGVSVGKNFYQLMNYLDGVYMMGYDLEEFNPLLKQKINCENAETEYWDKGNFLKPSLPSLTSNMRYKHTLIDYISADIFDEKGWEKLRNKNFNLILSDASHTPEAILFEYEMMEKYHIFNRDSFIIFWDDLGGKMTESFLSIITHMKKKYNINRTNCYLLELSGWIGQQEFKHQIGIIDKSDD